MNKLKIIGMGCLSVVLVFGMIVFSIFMWIVGIRRDEISIRQRFEAQEMNIETSLDNSWRNISSQFRIAEEYKDTVIQLMKEVSAGRQGGSLFRSQTESNNPLGLDSSLFSSLMVSVEANGNRFTNEQRILADIYREWNVLYRDPIKGMFLKHVEPIPEPQMIISGRAREAINSGIAPDSFL